jgi:hypothetical protein
MDMVIPSHNRGGCKASVFPASDYTISPAGLPPFGGDFFFFSRALLVIFPVLSVFVERGLSFF